MSSVELKPGVICESLSDWNTKQWEQCRVIAVDQNECIVRWLTGVDAGCVEVLDDNERFYRPVTVKEGATQ